MNLVNKVALVTGAGVRIGRAIALGLAREGAHVVVHYNSSAGPAQQVVQEIEALGGEAEAIQADLRDVGRLAALVEAGVARWGQVDILVNSAAIFERGTLLATDEANWARHFDINIKAPFFLCQAFARCLQPEQRGHIINIADWRAERPGTQYMAYTLTKSALVALTRSLALALGPNVQVNAIAPGAILPPPDDADRYFERLAERLPLKRTGSPEEIVATVLYLLHSDFVTGELLHVTGGEHL
jgi:pteridine reductase